MLYSGRAAVGLADGTEYELLKENSFCWEAHSTWTALGEVGRDVIGAERRIQPGLLDARPVARAHVLWPGCPASHGRRQCASSASTMAPGAQGSPCTILRNRDSSRQRRAIRPLLTCGVAEQARSYGQRTLLPDVDRNCGRHPWQV